MDEYKNIKNNEEKTEEDYHFVKQVIKKKSKQPKDILCDAAADSINEKAVDLTGDVILEDNGAGYEIIEDYLSDISLCLDEI